ncbi:MAG: caspase family protein [Polaribacter sp.]|uniref:caspase family protein n=1 Tax=Polaribacter sp. TaxID=1920175 RepID=UPI002F35DED9
MRKFLVIICFFFSVYIFAQLPEISIPFGHSESINSINISSKGKYLLSGSENLALLHDINSGAIIRRHELKSKSQFSENIENVLFSKNDEFYAVSMLHSSTSNSTTNLYEMKSGEVLISLNGYTPINNFGFTNLLPTISGDTLTITLIKKKKDIFKESQRLDPISNKSLYLTDKNLYLGHSSGYVTSVNLESLSQEPIYSHKDAVEEIIVSPNENYIVSSSLDQSLIIYDLVNSKKTIIASQSNNRYFKYESIFITPDSKNIICSSFSKLYIYDIETGLEINSIEMPDSIVSFNYKTLNKEIIVATLKDIFIVVNFKDIVLLMPDEDTLEKKFMLYNSKNNTLIFPNNKVNFNIYSLESGDLLNTITSMGSKMTSAFYNSKNKVLTIGSTNGLFSFNTETGKTKKLSTTHITHLSKGFNEDEIVASSIYGGAEIFDLTKQSSKEIETSNFERYNESDYFQGETIETKVTKGGKYLVSKSFGDRLSRNEIYSIFNIKGQKLSFQIEGKETYIFDYITISTIKNTIAVIKNNNIYQFKLTGFELINASKSVGLIVDNRIEYNSDGSYIIVKGYNEVRVIESENLKTIIVKTKTDKIGYDFSFLLNTDKDLMTILSEGIIYIYNLKSLKVVGEIKENKKPNNILFLDKLNIVQVYFDNEIKYYSKKGELIKRFKNIKTNSIAINLKDLDYTVFAGNQGEIKIIDNKNNNIKSQYLVHNSQLESISFVKDSLLISVFNDGLAIISNFITTKEVCRFIILDKENLFCSTPDLYYSFSKKISNNIFYKMGLRVYPFSQFDLKYNRPDIVLKRIGDAPQKLIDLYYKVYQKRLKRMKFTDDMITGEHHLPKISIQNKTHLPYNTKTDLLKIKVNSTDSKHPLDRINVWINNVPIYGVNGIPLRSKMIKEFNTTLKLKLNNGKNKIELSVVNQAGSESYREAFYVNSTKALPKPNLYLIVLSVSEYLNKNFNLRYAQKDGKDIVNLFQSNKGKLYNKVIVKKLFNKEVTLENITKLKRKLKKAKTHDEVIVYISGHGVLDKNFDFYFAAYDMNFKNASERGISYDFLEDLLDDIPPRKKLLLMDACHGGEVDKDDLIVQNQSKKLPSNGEKGNVIKYSYRGTLTENKNTDSENSPFQIMQETFVNLDRRNGASVISASAGDSYAYESKKWNNGVFTYSILNGLKNNAADLNNDKEITLNELKKYVSNEVIKQTEGRQKPNNRYGFKEYDYRIW